MRTSSRTKLLALILAATTVSGGLVALSGPMDAPLLPIRVPWLALVAAFVVAECLWVRLHFRSEAHEFNLTEAPLVIGLFGATPLALVTASLTAILLVRIYRRQSPLKAAFNLGLGAVEASVAIAIARVIADPGPMLAPQQWGAGLAGPAAATVCSSLLVALAIALTEGGPGLGRWVRSLGPSVTITTANASLALAGLMVVVVQPLAALLLVAPLAVLFLGYRAYVAQLEESGRLTFITRFTTAMASAGGVEESLRRLLRLTKDEMGGRTAEVLLLGQGEDAGARMRIRLDDDTFEVAAAVDSHDYDAVVRYLANAPGGEIVNDIESHPLQHYLAGGGIHDALLVPVPGEHGPLGLLVVGNREGDVTHWTRTDRDLAGAVARHTGAILRSAELQHALSAMAEERGRLLRESLHDELTGLVNRRGLQDALERAAEDKVPVAAIYIDLDDFKKVNDTHGHAVGDALLRAVGLRLRGIIRSGDVAARIGGDEFVILMVPARSDGATKEVAERATRVIAEPLHVGGVVVEASASVGIAAGVSLTDGNALLGRADRAMYRAKAARRRARARAARAAPVTKVTDLDLDAEPDPAPPVQESRLHA